MSLTDGPVTLLVVDDEEAIRNALRKYLVQQGYEVAIAATGEEALGVLQRQKITGMLLDVNLPGISGVELVPQIIELEPSIAHPDAHRRQRRDQRRALHAARRVRLPHQADRSGPSRPRHPPRPPAAAYLLEGQQINQWLKEEVAARVAERRLEQANQERISVATLEALVNALEAKDPYLRGHSARVADLSASVAAQHRLPPTSRSRRCGPAGRLHDIGKIGIREEILNKQGPLTDEEYEHVKQHVTVGSQILAPLVHLKDVIGFVRSHHERWDGFGYPDRLAGEAIPLGARIIGAVEIYDALTTARPYQEKMPRRSGGGANAGSGWHSGRSGGAPGPRGGRVPSPGAGLPGRRPRLNPAVCRPCRRSAAVTGFCREWS